MHITKSCWAASLAKMVSFWLSERSYLKIINPKRDTEKDIWNLILASTGIFIHIYATHTYTRTHMERSERERERQRGQFTILLKNYTSLRFSPFLQAVNHMIASMPSTSKCSISNRKK